MAPNPRRGPMEPTEGAILDKIETSLDQALSELDLPKNGGSHVKRQKYLYLAVDEFASGTGEPITYSWYKWGISCKAGPGSESPGKTLYTDEPSARALLDTSLEEFKQFFLEGVDDLPLESWWEADFLNFLKQFYQHYAPEDLRDLYLANIELQEQIDDISAAVMLERNPARESTYTDAQDITARLRKAVLSIDYLRDERTIVSDFTSLYLDVVRSLVNHESDDLRKGHQSVMSELLNFYRDHVWLILAHSISIRTAVGPNADQIQNDSRDLLGQLRSNFDDELNDNRLRCEAMDLIPSMEDYPDTGSVQEAERNRLEGVEFDSDEDEFEQKFEEVLTLVTTSSDE